MNKHYLHAQFKSSGTAYLCWFFFGCHYAYLNLWLLQILYWISFGGLGIWALIDLFHIPSKIDQHNKQVSMRIEAIEKKEKEEEFARNMALMNARK